MAKARKDLRGRALKKGEFQRRSDGRYVYTYTDPLGNRRNIYAKTLAELRERENKLLKSQLDGLDLYVSGKFTLAQAFDRYISIKTGIRPTTKHNYTYSFDHLVRDTFGRKKLADIKFSDVVQFYNYLLNEKGIAVNTLSNLSRLISSVFGMAVRDEVIGRNPADGAYKLVVSESDKSRGIRKALTVEQQRAFMDYIASHPVYYHWWPIFAILLGTGMRISECIGLTWDDIDFENNAISVNHTIVNYKLTEDGRYENHIAEPKTDAGRRTIPMLDVVRDAFDMLQEEQEETGFNESKIDGMSGFVFVNRYGTVPTGAALNRTIKRIVNAYNCEEEVAAAREKREPVILPEFSCHICRHTFCTRLCENETNLKVIQSIMGHKDISTTMDIYSEATESKKQETMNELSAKLNVF